MAQILDFLWGCMGRNLLYFQHDERPARFLDSLNLAMAITGSLLELNRKREQYYVWTISSVFTIALDSDDASRRRQFCFDFQLFHLLLKRYVCILQQARLV